MLQKSDLVVWLNDIEKDDESQVGKEASDLSEIAKLGIPIPKGFVVSANAYRQFIVKNNITAKAKQYLLVAKAKHLLGVPVLAKQEFDAKVKSNIKRYVMHGEIPENLVKEIFRAYKNLDMPTKNSNIVVSSSFNNEKFVNVKGEANLVQKIRSLWAEFFYLQNFHVLKSLVAIFVYKIPQRYRSGVMFTIDPVYNDKTVIVVNEKDTKNHYEISKDSLEIVNKVIKKGRSQTWPNLTDRQIIDLASWGKRLQHHYYFPQEVHFSADLGGVYVTRSKPITTITTKYVSEDWRQEVGKTSTTLQNMSPRKKRVNVRKVLLKGNSIYPGIATGYLRVIRHPYDIHKLRADDVAIIANTKNLKVNDVVRKVRGLIIESKSYHVPHFPISLRFYGKPIVVTGANSSKVLKEGIVATVNGINGEVYI
jgi:pyruvate,water dikinase